MAKKCKPGPKRRRGKFKAVFVELPLALVRLLEREVTDRRTTKQRIIEQALGQRYEWLG